MKAWAASRAPNAMRDLKYILQAQQKGARIDGS